MVLVFLEMEISKAKCWALPLKALSSAEALLETSHDQTLKVERFCGVIL